VLQATSPTGAPPATLAAPAVSVGTPIASPIASPPISSPATQPAAEAPARNTQKKNQESPYAGRGGRKLFVGQLPRSTTYADIYKLMSPFGEIEDLHVIRDRKTGQGTGAAFVVFASTESALQAIERYDGKITLEGVARPMHVRLAEGEVQADSDVKLFIGHVPPNTQESDLRPHFEQFEGLLEVSITRRVGRSGEASAFARYSSKNAAMKCIMALHRSLYLQGAKQPISVQIALTEAEKRRLRQQHAAQ